jgi:steroid delta-isomerase-like uncharacterized protein
MEGIMSQKGNKGLVQRLFDDVFNARQYGALEELIAENLLSHEASGFISEAGIQGFRQEIELIFNAFPDAAISIEDMVTENDRVVVRWRLRGTHHGELFTIPGTNRSVDFQGMTIYRLENQKIIEYWGVFDRFGLMSQMSESIK